MVELIEVPDSTRRVQDTPRPHPWLEFRHGPAVDPLPREINDIVIPQGVRFRDVVLGDQIDRVLRVLDKAPSLVMV